ncbi:MAG: hypothetical protein ABMB14_30365 [Myxococcota bacterium]
MIPLALAAGSLTGCFGKIPLVNEPPVLDAINGQDWPRDGAPAFDALAPGDDFPLTLEFHDPDNDGVRVWFPYAYGWVEFDPDDTSGVWHTGPFPGGSSDLTIALEDDRDPPQRSTWYLFFGGNTSCSGCTSSFR